MCDLAVELGGDGAVRDMIAGRGVSLILKDISVKFRRPVVFPDTVRFRSCVWFSFSRF